MSDKQLLVDWKEILFDLRRWGYFDSQIANAIDIERTSITRLRTNQQKTVTFDTGYKLLQFYEDKRAAKRIKPARKRLTQKSNSLAS